MVNKFTPIFLIIFYWLFFLLRSVYGTAFYLSDFAIFHFSIMLFFLSMGYLFYFLLLHNIEKARRIKILKINRRKAFASLFIIFLFLIYIGLNLGAFEMNFKEYFLFMRGSSEGAYHNSLEKMFGGNLILSGFEMYLIYPLYVGCQAVACSIIATSKSDIVFFIFAFFVSMLYGYIFQSGFLLETFFSFLAIGLFLVKKNKFDRLFMIKRLAFLTVIALALIYLNVRTRGESVIDNVEKYFLHYRTIGYSIYSVKLDDSESVLHKPSYGVSMLGEFGRISATILRRVGFSVPEALNANHDMMREIKEPVFIGLNRDGKEVRVNAFVTMLFDMYRDFHEAGIILFSFILGFFLAKLRTKGRFSEPHLACFFILMHALIAGNTMSQFSRCYIWLSMLFVRFILI